MPNTHVFMIIFMLIFTIISEFRYVKRMKILCVGLKRNLHTRPTKNQANETGLKNTTPRVLEVNPAFRAYAQCLAFFSHPSIEIQHLGGSQSRVHSKV